MVEELAGKIWRKLDALASLPLPTGRGSPGMPIAFDAVTTRVALNPPQRGRVDLAPALSTAAEREASARWRAYFDRLLGDAATVFDQVMPVRVEPVASLMIPSGAFAATRPKPAA
jgi:hypothetical protein